MSAAHRSPPRPGARLALFTFFALFALFASLLTVSKPARADLFDAPVLVIEPGREREVVALFAPARPGAELSPGVRFTNIFVRATDVRAELRVEPENATPETPAVPPASVLLFSRGFPPPPGHRSLGESASFALATDAPRDGPLAPAADALAASVRAHDAGGFFRARATASADAPLDARARTSGVYPFLTDGVFLLALLLSLTALLVAHEVRHSARARRVVAALLALFALSVALRYALSIETALDVWPYSRLGPLPRLVFRGPSLAWLTRHASVPTVTLSSVVFSVGTLCAVVTPVALFAHARPLLGDTRAALAACIVLCFLPAHLRFSRSDTGYIPSAWLTALAFALAHHSAYARGRLSRLVALCALPPVWLLELDVRPLNVLFAPLALADLWLLSTATSPDNSHADSVAPSRRTRAVTTAVIIATLGYYLFTGYLSHNRAQIREGLSAGSLLRGAGSFFVPWRNTLVHPYVTPTGVLALAVFGFVTLRRGEKRARWLALYLVAWLVVFYVFHGIVHPPVLEMQARYHLQLATPLALLAGAGLAALSRTRPRVAYAALAYVLLAPLIHLRFVRDVRFDDVREYDFVRESAARVPRGCAVLEYDWPDGAGRDLRFRRAGTALDRGDLTLRFAAISLANPARERDPSADALAPAARAALASHAVAPGSGCLYYYEGLSCFTQVPAGTTLAPACEAARAARPWSVAAESPLYGRFYDDHYRVPGGRAVTLTLYRAR